jgi:hypothetical protein
VPPLVIIFSQVFAVNNIKCVFVVSSTSLSIREVDRLEQSTYHKEDVAYEEGRKWNYIFNLIHEEEREKKMKIRLEKQHLEKKKKEQEEKDLRETEREKKRERARRAREDAQAQEDATKRKGKYPRWTQ